MTGSALPIDLRYTLKQYYPQALEWFDRIDTPLFCDFIERWPTLIQIKRARRTTLETFFHQHNMRFAHVLEDRIQAIKGASPLTLDDAVITPHRLQAVVLVDQLRVALNAIKLYDTQIAELAPRHPDFALFDALPGAGPSLAPRLLVAFGEQRDRFNSAAELQALCRHCSGDRAQRKESAGYIGDGNAPTFLRQTFVEWAAQTINKSFWAGAYYQQQCDKGCSYNAAVRASGI